MGNLIWLASFPKSGNTWLRAFLHNLLLNPDKPIYINDLDTFCLGESALSHFKKFDPRPYTEYTEQDVAKLRPQVHRKFTTASPDSVFVKTHNALLVDHGLPVITLEVTAGTIYVMRNPLDVTISLAHHLAIPIEGAIRSMALPGTRTKNSEKFVYELRGSWSQHVASWTARPHPALHVVRYEDMIERPEQTFAGVARFLGLNPPRARLLSAINMASFPVLKEQERQHGFREKPDHAEAFFREGKAGQWKTKLAREQVAAVVRIHRQQMTRFGYVPPGF